MRDSTLQRQDVINDCVPRGFIAMIFRAALAAFMTFWFAILTNFPALGDYRQSRIWFESLLELERNRIQSELILVGLYDGLVDGEIGPNTNAAILSFEQNAENNQNGILEPEELRLLGEQSEKVFNLVAH